MTQSSKFLQEILTKSAELLSAGRPVLCVYDLDSTLFDVQPRTERILREFADLPELHFLDSDSAKLLREIKTLPTDWGIREPLERSGLLQKSPELMKRAGLYWGEKFFSNDYLRFDQPVPGALEFVLKMQNLGAQHIYLTGRSRPHMEIGSLATLRHWGFPLSEDGRELVMKEQYELEDFAFKEEWFLKQNLDGYGLVWFFENEPINLERVQMNHPEVRLVFFDSTHSGRRPVLAGIPAIKDFLIQLEEGL